MAGAWELLKNPSVLVATLSVETTSMAWALGLRNLLPHGCPFLPLHGMPFDHARNAACMRALEGGFEYLFFLDSDVIPPRDAILRLLQHRVPMVSGIYCRRSPPAAVPVLIKGGTWVTQLPAKGLFEVDYCGAGCLLIHREVLERLPPLDPERGRHWFSWRVDMNGILPPGEALSEDFSFCLHARRHGVPTLVDPTVRCRHVGYAQADYGSFVPLDCTPVT